jgi:hypothetical protein
VAGIFVFEPAAGRFQAAVVNLGVLLRPARPAAEIGLIFDLDLVEKLAPGTEEQGPQALGAAVQAENRILARLMSPFILLSRVVV